MVLPSRLAEGLSANTLLNMNMYECMYHTWVVFYNGSGQSDVISFLFFSHSNRTIPCEISGSHGGEYEVYSLLGCSAV
jgi:hypothetical protein